MGFSSNTFVGEIWEITTYDGLIYQASDYQSRAILTTPGDLGLPPVDLITRKPYKQPGEIELNYRLGVRDFSILLSQRGCSREAYWQARMDLLQVCRPNRGGPVTLTLIRADNSRVAIDARCLSPVFPETPVEEWREWGFTEQVQLRALQPTFYTPTQVVDSSIDLGFTELAFPIAFDDDNIYFGDSNFFGRFAITYTGTWYSMPVLEIEGPFDTALIVHETLNRFIQYNAAVGVGSTLTIDLSANPVTVTVNGVDTFGYLAPQSDLSQFRIEVDPLVPGGLNQIGFNLPGFTAATTATIRYYTRWIGI